MAIFGIQISSLSRGAGRRATAAAAYRAGERVRDERGGRLYNFSRRSDVLHSEIFLPAQYEGIALPWARQRASGYGTPPSMPRSNTTRAWRVSIRCCFRQSSTPASA